MYLLKVRVHLLLHLRRVRLRDVEKGRRLLCERVHVLGSKGEHLVSGGLVWEGDEVTIFHLLFQLRGVCFRDVEVGRQLLRERVHVLGRKVKHLVSGGLGWEGVEVMTFHLCFQLRGVCLRDVEVGRRNACVFFHWFWLGVIEHLVSGGPVWEDEEVTRVATYRFDFFFTGGEEGSVLKNLII